MNSATGSAHPGAQHPGRQRDLDDGAPGQLAPATFLDDAVDADLAAGDEVPGVRAGVGEVRELEELAQTNLALDLDDVVGTHGPDHAKDRSGAP